MSENIPPKLCEACGESYIGKYAHHLDKECKARGISSSGHADNDAVKTIKDNVMGEEISSILSDKRLFERITIDELGKRVVGEVDTCQTIFLCGCGIWVENHDTTSYNLMQSAEAGSGKDYTINATLAVFPSDIYLKRTRISGKVLSYWHRSDKEPNWSWNGKILYLEDASQELMDSPVVKVFLSNGSFATILINQIATDLEIKGKPVMIFSSATAKLNKEQGRRAPMLRCDESNTQTKKIMHQQAKAAKNGKVITSNPKITEALGYLKRVKVRIPFAVGIEQALPANNIILRTHFPRLLDYIKASCALHQFQREKEGEYYLATQQDYEHAAIAFKKITSNPFSIPLSHEEQKMLEKIDELQAIRILEMKDEKQAQLTEKPDFEGFTCDELEPHIQFWRDTQLREELRKLTDVGLLVSGKRRKEEGKAGRSALTYRRPDLTKIELPDWETISKLTTQNTETTETTEINKTTETTEETLITDQNMGVVSINSVSSVNNQGGNPLIGEVSSHG